MPSQLTHTSSPELPNTPSSSKKPSPNVREVAGGTTANICVVFCCCPCGMVECLVKVPVNMIRRMWRKQRHKMTMAKSKAKTKTKTEGKFLDGVVEGSSVVSSGVHGEGYFEELSDVAMREFDKGKEVSGDGLMSSELDDQIWDQFNDTGFWRTASQRHTS